MRKRHAAAPWCRKLYTRTIYTWVEVREGARILLKPEWPFSLVGQRLVRAMDRLRVNQWHERQGMRAGQRKGWT